MALEPSYFDKTSDYPCGSPDNRYLLSIQNCGVTLDSMGRRVPVMEDVRNGNGRAIKSRLWSPDRVDRIDDPLDAVFWIMKDPVLGAAMGATLATKRSSAERLASGVDPEALVFEPFANPFRTYPLREDYEKFKGIFGRGVRCFVLNTGHFMGRKVPKDLTLQVLLDVVEGRCGFQGLVGGMDYLPIEGFEPPVDDPGYREVLRRSLEARIRFLGEREECTGGYDSLPDECVHAIGDLVAELGGLVKKT